ncbi:MAG: hypothetical protein M1469_00370 [Bacteroidetes bacterium]|nr:hypothetical protein [Bacteroidota bacterium]
MFIALLTYWRFRGIELSAVFAYVAQQDVIRSAMFQSLASSRSIFWDFFGLINKIVMPHSIAFLRIVGAIVMVINFVLLYKLINYMLGQKFWGFLGVFLAALSPFAVVAAVSGGSAAVAAAIATLFLMALYRNEYIFGGILAGAAFAANLPGLIMFLIVILDLLQNLEDRSKLIQRLLSAAAGFFAVGLLVFLYSVYSGNSGIFSIPLGENDLKWTFVGVVPMIVVNILNFAGILYLIVKKRYDVYKTHFHTLMMWITSCALCIVQPSTLNLLFALTVSSVLGMFFLQGFASLWKVKLVSQETFVFLFVVLFLFSDVYANNTFLKDVVLADSLQKNEAIEEVVASILPVKGNSLLVSNFAPAELSVKLGRAVYAVEGEPLPVGNPLGAGYSTIFVTRRKSKVDSLSGNCRNLFSTSYMENKQDYFVQVIECREDK